MHGILLLKKTQVQTNSVRGVGYSHPKTPFHRVSGRLGLHTNFTSPNLAFTPTRSKYSPYICEPESGKEGREAAWSLLHRTIAMKPTPSRRQLPDPARPPPGPFTSPTLPESPAGRPGPVAATHVSELGQATLAHLAEALVGRAALEEELRQAHRLAAEQRAHGGRRGGRERRGSARRAPRRRGAVPGRNPRSGGHGGAPQPAAGSAASCFRGAGPRRRPTGGERGTGRRRGQRGRSGARPGGASAAGARRLVNSGSPCLEPGGRLLLVGDSFRGAASHPRRTRKMGGKTARWQSRIQPGQGCPVEGRKGENTSLRGL